MSTAQSTIDFLLEQLSSLPSVRAKKMFGEYALYCDEKVVALVCDDKLYIKPTDVGKSIIGSIEEAPPYPGAKLYYHVALDRCEDRDWFAHVVTATADSLPRPIPKKKKR